MRSDKYDIRFIVPGRNLEVGKNNLAAWYLDTRTFINRERYLYASTDLASFFFSLSSFYFPFFFFNFVMRPEDENLQIRLIRINLGRTNCRDRKT